MKTIEAGTGEAACRMGGETVLFRHEKTLVNRTRFAVRLSSDMEDAQIDARLREALSIDFERIGEREGIDRIYAALGKLRETHPDWSVFLITSDKTVEESLGTADRRRKLYNGRLEACYYQYHGIK